MIQIPENKVRLVMEIVCKIMKLSLCLSYWIESNA